MSGGESALWGGLQGVSLGFADEMEGVAGGLADLLSGGDFDYSGNRDEARRKYAAAEGANPELYRGGEVVGAVGGALLPGGAAAKGLKGAMALGAATGAAQGLGTSEADLTEGEVGEVLTDTAIGGAVGAGAGAVGHGVSKAVSALRGRAAQGVRLAEADQAATEYGSRYAAKKSAESSLGGEAAAGLRALREAEEVVANASGHYTPAQISKAQAFLADPKAAAVRQRAAENVLDRGADRLGGSLVDAEKGLAQARGALAPAAVEAGAEAAMANPVRREIAPRVWTLGHRLLPVMLASGGAAVGGPEGAAIGGGLGTVMALTQGRPGTIIRNAVRSPGVRKMVWEFVESAAGGPVLGSFGAMLQRALQTGGTRAGLALHEALLERDPEYAAAVERAVIEAGGEE
jgi:hypothetical protein